MKRSHQQQSRHLRCGALVLSLLTALIAMPAHAGLLGGGGGIGGGLGGSLSGGLSGLPTRDPIPPLQRASNAAKERAQDARSETGSGLEAARDKLQQGRSSTDAGASGSLGKTLGGNGNTTGSKPVTAGESAGTSKPQATAELQGSGQAQASREGVSASAEGSARAQR